MNSRFQLQRSRKAGASALATLLIAIQLLAVTSGPTFPDPGHPGISRDDQRAMGLQVAAQVYKQMPVLPDNSPETQYIRQLGQKLVATIPPEHSWPFEFHVIPQKEINAFALPGGPMFVNIGTITAAQNEAELAGVMAHEMAHVYMQHSAKQAEKAQLTSGLAGLAGAILGSAVGGIGGQLAQMGVQMGAGTIMLKYSRNDESQADAVGAIILYKAGYNPQSMADFFKTLETQGGGAPPQWMSDHPNPGNREQAIEKEIQGWPPKNYQVNSAAFQKVKQQAAGVRAYTSEEIAAGAKSGQWAAMNKQNGAVFNGGGGAAPTSTSAPAPAPTPSPTASPVSLSKVLPSQRMVSENLGPMKLSRPDNWQVNLPKQNGDYAVIAPPAGVASNGVGYGVLINAVAPPQGQRMDIDTLTSQLVQNLQQTQGVTPVGSTRTINVGGTQGRAIMLQSTSPFPTSNGEQQAEADWLVTVPHPNGAAFYFVFVAPQSQFDRFRPTFQSMLKSVSF